jgi:hypothetical protein
LLIPIKVISQDSTSTHKLHVSGYISSLQTIMTEGNSTNWLKENTLHNPLNMNWNLSNTFSFDLQLRNRFIYGDLLQSDPSYARSYEKDKGIVGLAHNWVTGNSYLLNTQIDRLYITTRQKKFTFTAGRQRINWGQTFVWNPNDIFNTYSYFDFDYPERPGSDALRFEYFTGYASGFEAALKTDSTGKVTGAALIKLNKWNYDIQFLGGIYESKEMVLGLGWSGNIGNVGFYGELSYFKGIASDNYKRSYFFSSVAASYTTKNALNIQTEFLYSYNPDGYSYNNFSEVLNRPLNVKTLAFSKYSVFCAIGYPFSPLLSGNFSWMWMPSINANYIGPNITYSLGNNLDASLVIQYFRAKFKNEILSQVVTQTFTIGLLRLKFSF